MDADVSMTTSEALDHTLKAYGRLERKHAETKRECDRLREENDALRMKLDYAVAKLERYRADLDPFDVGG